MPMSWRALLTFALTVVASCAPAARPSPGDLASAPPSASSPTPAASRTVAVSDVVTIRQAGGPATTLAVRSVATGAVQKEVPDGVLLPDGRTLITVETGTYSVMIARVDRVTGERGRTTTLQAYWKLRPTFGGPGGLSGNGKWLGLVGSAFNFSDPAGQWTGHSEFGVLDTELTSLPRVVKLDGNYTLETVSDDGRSLYLVESTPPDRPTRSRLLVYDLASGALVGPTGDELPPLNGFRTDPIRIGAAAYSLIAFGQDAPYLVRLDVDAREVRVMRVPTERAASGETALLWSMAKTRDGKTLFVANPAAGVVNEIDVASLTVRRTGKLSAAPDGGILAAIASWIVPVAEAKMIVRAGAILSGDEQTLYVVAEAGVRAIETRTLAPRQFAAAGQFADLALSPDGARLYALNAFGRWMSVFDARSGERLADIDVGGYPQAIVAVDPR
jgi:hypothetical protein